VEYATNFANGRPATFTNIGGCTSSCSGDGEVLQRADVHKQKKVNAKTALTNADCGVKVKKKETHKTKFRGKVLKQKKAPGTTAAPGTVVAIVIGQK
jgi:beta-lactam-binding protein with PASTA domain